MVMRNIQCVRTYHSIQRSKDMTYIRIDVPIRKAISTEDFFIKKWLTHNITCNTFQLICTTDQEFDVH